MYMKYPLPKIGLREFRIIHVPLLVNSYLLVTVSPQLRLNGYTFDLYFEDSAPISGMALATCQLLFYVSET